MTETPYADNRNAEIKRPYWLVLTILCIVIVAFVLATPYLVQWYRCLGSDATATEGHGTFGDQFGGTTALFSGLAFAGLLGTLWMQRDELRAQRKTLNLQRDELEASRVVYQEQARQLTLQSAELASQNFERQFFQLIDLLRHTLDDVTINSINNRLAPHANHGVTVEVSGPRALFMLFGHVWNEYDRKFRISKRSSAGHEESCEFIRSELSALGISLEPYIQVLTVLLRLVTAGDLQAVSKRFYFEIIEAQLSESELAFIFYYCGDRKKSELNVLCQTSGILARLPHLGLLDERHHEFQLVVSEFNPE